MPSSFSGPAPITVDGQTYDVRTAVEYPDGQLSSNSQIRYVAQYRPRPALLNQWVNLAERDRNSQNGWAFNPAAGSAFRQRLADRGPNSLTASLDGYAENALARDAGLPQSQARNVLQTSPNAAPTAPDQNQNVPTAAGGSGTSAAGRPEASEAELDREVGNERSDTRNEFRGARGSSPLVYPITMSSLQDSVKFQMIRYSPRSQNREGGQVVRFGDRREIQISDIIGTVILPIPSGISDSNQVDWGSDTLDPLNTALARVAIASIENGVGAGVDAAASQAQAAVNDPQTSGAVATAFAAAAIGTNTADLLSRTRGIVLNPNMELLFRGPSLRPFNFTFKLSARSEEESKAIRSIIRFFKQGMAPIRTRSQVFLKAPHTFKITYTHRADTFESSSNEHRYLNKIKECALTSFSVDYTPEGQYATFTSGAMVSYQVTMQFQELEPVFNDEYGPGNNSGYETSIGY